MEASIARACVSWLLGCLGLALGLVGCGGSGGGPCAGVSCSNHGECVQDEGAVSCDCADGFRAVGLTCVGEEGDGGVDPDPVQCAGQLCLQSGGIRSLESPGLRTGNLRVHSDGFEGAGRSCAGSTCVEGGIAP